MTDFLKTSKPQILDYQQIETFIHGDMAYEFGKFDMYQNPQGGQKKLFRQRCITVYNKDAAGQWKLYRWMGQD